MFLSTKYFFTLVSPERGNTYNDALAILSAINPSQFELGLSCITETIEQRDSFGNRAEFETFLINNISAAIEEFSVYLADDLNYTEELDHLVKMLNGLYSIDHYEAPSELLQIMGYCENHNEIIAELLATVTGGQVEQHKVMLSVVDVSPMLIKRIRENLQERTREGEIDTIDKFPEITKRIKAYLSNANEIIRVAVNDFLREGGGMNNSLDGYIDYYYEKLNKLQPKEAAALLVALAIMAGLKNADIVKEISERVTGIFESPHTLIEVSRSLNSIPLPDEVNNEEA